MSNSQKGRLYVTKNKCYSNYNTKSDMILLMGWVALKLILEISQDTTLLTGILYQIHVSTHSPLLFYILDSI
jgi:hypothetical protein